MKVICGLCSNLADENEAIKISFIDLKGMKQVIYQIPIISFESEESSHYTQICPACYYLYRCGEYEEIKTNRLRSNFHENFGGSTCKV